MKKFFTIVLAAMAFAGSARALNRVPEPGFTFKGLFGLNFSNFRDMDISGKYDAKPGFHVGVQGEYMIHGGAGTYVNLGLLYTMKGAKLGAKVFDSESTASLKFRPMYVEIPIHIGYRYNLFKRLGIYADIGPYVAFGTNGKTILSFDKKGMDDVKVDFFRNAKNNSHIGDIQRFDCGMGFRIGLEYADHHSLTLGIDWGITDMYRDKYRDRVKQLTGTTLPKLKTFNSGITYAYRF